MLLAPQKTASADACEHVVAAGGQLCQATVYTTCNPSPESLQRFSVWTETRTDTTTGKFSSLPNELPCLLAVTPSLLFSQDGSAFCLYGFAWEGHFT